MRTLAAVILAAAVGLPGPVAGATPPLPAPLTIDWTMDGRFGLDRDGNGIVDLPNTAAYVGNQVLGCDPCGEARFVVLITVSGPATELMRSFTWSITPPEGGSAFTHHTVEPVLELALAEGVHQVEVAGLIPLPFRQVSLRARAAVTVEDLLIVAIGDSYASGEGNPEVRRGDDGSEPLWGDGDDAAASRAHTAARRSSVAWPARTALVMEQSDPRTSVTFVSVASSGARTDWGILSPQGDLPAQVDQLAALVGERRIDLLLIQEGGNSIGFTRLVRALVEADPLFDPICYHMMVDQAVASALDGNWRRGTGVSFSLPFRWSCVPEVRATGAQLPGLIGLGDAMRRLDSALERFDIGRVVLVGYPDPTGGGADGERCREIVGDVTPPLRFHEISRDEGRRGVAEVLQPLNAALAAVATEHGWGFVDGVAESFAAGHGYCATWPSYQPAVPETGGRAFTALDFPDSWYRNPGTRGQAMGAVGVTWYRTAAQSAVLQGPGAPYTTNGTLHPNEIGHAAIADLVLEYLTSRGFGAQLAG